MQVLDLAAPRHSQRLSSVADIIRRSLSATYVRFPTFIDRTSLHVRLCLPLFARRAQSRSSSIGRAVLQLRSGAREVASRVVRFAAERSSSLGRALSMERFRFTSHDDKMVRQTTRALRHHCSRKVSHLHDADLKKVRAFLEPAGLAELAPRFVTLGLTRRKQFLALDLKV